MVARVNCAQSSPDMDTSYFISGPTLSEKDRLFDPVMSKLEHDRKKSQDFSRKSYMNQKELKRWMKVKHAAQILKIKLENVYGMTADEAKDHYHRLVLNEGFMLGEAGRQDAYTAAECLTEFCTSKLHSNTSKQYFLKRLVEERQKTRDELAQLTDGYRMYFFWALAFFFTVCCVMFLLGGALIMKQNPDLFYGIFKQAAHLSRATVGLMEKREFNLPKALCVPRAEDMELDSNILGSNFTYAGGSQSAQTLSNISLLPSEQETASRSEYHTGFIEMIPQVWNFFTRKSSTPSEQQSYTNDNVTSQHGSFLAIGNCGIQSADPLYEELMDEAAIVKQRERNIIQQLIGKIDSLNVN